MSRSYKKYPSVKDRDSSKWGKRYCNKKVRKTLDIPNGKVYKRIFESWDYITDYRFHLTWKDYQKISNATYYEWYKIYKQK